MVAPNGNPTLAPRRTQGEGPVGRMITVGGVGAAAAMMIISIIKSAGSTVAAEPHTFSHAILRKEFSGGDPRAWAAAACILLVITPSLRMLWLILMLSGSKRPGFAFAAFIVLLALLAGFVGLWLRPDLL